MKKIILNMMLAFLFTSVSIAQLVDIKQTMNENEKIWSSDFRSVVPTAINVKSAKIDGKLIDVKQINFTQYNVVDGVDFLFLLDNSDKESIFSTRKPQLELSKQIIELLLKNATHGQNYGVFTFNSKLIKNVPINSSVATTMDFIRDCKLSEVKSPELFKSISESINYLNSRNTKRKAIIVLSSGKSSDVAYDASQVIKNARMANIAIHSIAIADDDKDYKYLDVLQRISDETNGLCVKLENLKSIPLKELKDIILSTQSGGNISVTLPSDFSGVSEIQVLLEYTNKLNKIDTCIISGKTEISKSRIFEELKLIEENNAKMATAIEKLNLSKSHLSEIKKSFEKITDKSTDEEIKEIYITIFSEKEKLDGKYKEYAEGIEIFKKDNSKAKESLSTLEISNPTIIEKQDIESLNILLKTNDSSLTTLGLSFELFSKDKEKAQKIFDEVVVKMDSLAKIFIEHIEKLNKLDTEFKAVDSSIKNVDDIIKKTSDIKKSLKPDSFIHDITQAEKDAKENAKEINDIIESGNEKISKIQDVITAAETTIFEMGSESETALQKDELKKLKQILSKQKAEFVKIELRLKELSNKKVDIDNIVNEILDLKIEKEKQIDSQKAQDEKAENIQTIIIISCLVVVILIIIIFIVVIIRKSKSNLIAMQMVQRAENATETLKSKLDMAKKEASILAYLKNSNGETFEIRSEFVRIGRSANNDYQIQNTSVSTSHAEIRYTSDREFLITDLQSTNGTFVNNQRITKATLKDGDVIEFGSEIKVIFIKR